MFFKDLFYRYFTSLNVQDIIESDFCVIEIDNNNNNFKDNAEGN
jgi:hypothetical protein